MSLPYLFDVSVAPGRLAINKKNGVRAFMAGGRPKGQIYAAGDWKAAHADAVEEIAAEWETADPLTGPVAVELDTWWPRRHRKGAAAGEALGDVDAAGKALLDALALAGVLGDDAQVREFIQRKHYGPARAEIRVRSIGAEA